MICPTCGFDNLPGDETCSNCQQDLTVLDRPAPDNRVEQSLMEDRVGSLRQRQPLTIGASATVRQAIDTMLQHDVGALLVIDTEGKLLGIFSERDLLKKVAGEHVLYADMPVSSFMTPKPATVTPSDVLALVLHKMDTGGYRHVPAVENGKPVSVVSVRDMLRHITRLCKDG